VNNIKQFIINLALGFVALNLFGWVFCTGESFLAPIPKTTTITVPFNAPIH